MLQRIGDDVYTRVLERHHQLIRAALVEQDGVEVATEGDSFFAVFTDPLDAVATAAAITRSTAGERWPLGERVLVRIGLHTGSAVVGGDNYVGVDVHRAARISSAAHGGQILLSSTTTELVRDGLPDATYLIDLDRVHLADLNQPEHLGQLTLEDGPSEFPPLRGASNPSRLPDLLTEFFGREEEMARGGDLLVHHRLVTLTGPGGTGKTRLAIELAHRVTGQFEDGAFFVSLASTHDAMMIPSAILDRLGLRTDPHVEPPTHLVTFLRDRTLLLVLDNLEQLAHDVSIIARILAEAPSVKVLATSRGRLRIGGERELPVPPLPVPSSVTDVLEEYAGTRLLIDRVRAVRPGFSVTDDDRVTLSVIANRLDGLPLAIELAASRMRSLTPELVLERLDNRLLSSGPSDLPERQRTMVNTIGWSYDLLDEAERALFERCSVFSGSFGLTEAELVCGEDGVEDVLEGLIALDEASLIQQTDGEGELRYRMLVVIREYAHTRLVARQTEREVSERHARVYLDLAERAEKEILSSRQGYWLNRLSQDHDNLRAAIDWALEEREATLAQRLVGALWRFWQFRGHLLDAEEKIAAALNLDGGEPRARARALTAQGGITYWRGDWEKTLNPYSEAHQLMLRAGERHEIAEALYNLSFPVGYLGDVDRAEAMFKEALEIYEDLGDEVGVGRAYWGLADNQAFRENWHGILEYLEIAAGHLEHVDAPFDLGWTWFMGGWASLHLEQAAEALRRTRESLEIFVRVEDISALNLVFELAAGVAYQLGDNVGAARLYGAAAGIQAKTGIAISDVDINRLLGLERLIDEGDQVVSAAFAEGRELGVEEAVELVRRMDPGIGSTVGTIS